MYAESRQTLRRIKNIIKGMGPSIAYVQMWVGEPNAKRLKGYMGLNKKEANDLGSKYHEDTLEMLKLNQLV